MHLITMAHLGEAQGVIETFRLQKKDQDLFLGEGLVLLITGEGPFEASTKTALTLSKFDISSVINLGIAGSLNPKHEVGTVHSVRTVYLLQGLKPQFKTFQSSDEGLDCLTSFERILDQEKAQNLRGLGELIDRECWGVAFAAKTAGIPFSAWKVISDIAGTIDACELVREKAQDYSHLLARKLETLLSVKKEIAVRPELKGFYFTFSSQHRFESLLSKLAIKCDSDVEAVIATLPLEELREIKTSPKDRGKRLLDLMEDLIDPTKKLLETKRSTWEKTFQNHGFKVQTDPTWENPEVQITFTVRNDQELAEKISALSTLSVAPYEKILSGDFHVE